jgi:hypothetical protein
MCGGGECKNPFSSMHVGLVEDIQGKDANQRQFLCLLASTIGVLAMGVLKFATILRPCRADRSANSGSRFNLVVLENDDFWIFGKSLGATPHSEVLAIVRTLLCQCLDM